MLKVKATSKYKLRSELLCIIVHDYLQYSNPASMSWILQGPTMTTSLSSSPRRMSAQNCRAIHTVSFALSDYNGSHNEPSMQHTCSDWLGRCKTYHRKFFMDVRRRQQCIIAGNSQVLHKFRFHIALAFHLCKVLLVCGGCRK